MRAESQTAPKRVRVEQLGPEADVILAENIELIDRDGEGHYRFDEYRMRVPIRPNLKESIESNFAGWLEFAKLESSRPSDQEIAEAEQTLKVVDILMEVGLL